MSKRIVPPGVPGYSCLDFDGVEDGIIYPEVTSSTINRLTAQLEKLEKEITKDDKNCIAFCTAAMACLIIFSFTTSIVGAYIWFNFLYVCCSFSLSCSIFWSVIIFGCILIQLLCNLLEDKN